MPAARMKRKIGVMLAREARERPKHVTNAHRKEKSTLVNRRDSEFGAA